MLTKQLQVEIGVLQRQGKGIREIAREMGVTRNTVRAALRGQRDEGYGPRAPRPTKLDEHKDYLRDRGGASRPGTARRDGLASRDPCSRLCRRHYAAQGVLELDSAAAAD